MPKQYEPPSQLACEHFEGEDADGNPIAVPCPGFCPKLVITSWAPDGYPHLGPFDIEGKAIPHRILFTEAEVRRLVKEADNGYFDLADMPPRKESRFWSPLTQMLMESLETNPVRALGILLFLGQPQGVAYTAEPEPVLALLDAEGEWLWIKLNADITDLGVAEPAEDAPVDGEEVEIPAAVTAYNPHPPEGATILWTRPIPPAIEETPDDNRPE